MTPDRRPEARDEENLVDAIAANIATINEVLAELTVVVSDDPEFSALVRETLRDHSHALGFSFQGD
jgi:hypothetical protein